MADARRDPPHVLAIDDDDTNLKLLRSVLSNCRVTTYEGPEEALAALRGGLRPDLIVCDVTMPGMTGFELHGELRAMPALQGVPFVYLTALDAPTDRRYGMGLGADDYLTKPYTPAELREAVSSRLARVEGLRSAPDGAWRIVSLDGFDVRVGASRMHWESRRSAELFLLLLEAYEAGGVPVREVRQELWWHPPEGNQLHALVSRLRKALGGAARVESDGEMLVLSGFGEVHWDVPTFERAAQEALGSGRPDALEAALAAYRGPFLKGSDGPWVERVRARLEETMVALLDATIEASDGARRERARRRLEAFLDEP